MFPSYKVFYYQIPVSGRDNFPMSLNINVSQYTASLIIIIIIIIINNALIIISIKYQNTSVRNKC
jgi:hypothetical protein